MRFEIREDYPGELLERADEARKGLVDGLAAAVARAHAEAGQPAPTRDPMRPSRDLVDEMAALFARRLPRLLDDVATFLGGERKREASP